MRSYTAHTTARCFSVTIARISLLNVVLVSGNVHGPTRVLATWLLHSASSCIILCVNFFSPRDCFLFWTALVFISSVFDRAHILWHLKVKIYHKTTSHCVPLVVSHAANYWRWDSRETASWTVLIVCVGNRNGRILNIHPDADCVLN